MWCSFEGDEFGYLIADNTDASDSSLVGFRERERERERERGGGSVPEFEICSKNL